MPLFYQHTINRFSRLAIWHISEDEDFFLEKVPFQNEKHHPQKRLQNLAARFLLQILYKDFPIHLIEISETGKPLLTDERFHFSISHCGNYAAAIVSKKKLVGIDIELITPKIEAVKNRFLTENEIELLESNKNSTVDANQFITLFWCAKEVIFKWYGRGHLSFKNNMRIEKIHFQKEEGFITAHFIKDDRIELKIQFIFFGKLCLAWL